MRIVFAAALAAVFVATPAMAQERGSSVGVGVTAGSLGIGPEINWRSDSFGVRGSATFFNLSRGVDSDGIEYDGDLKLRSFGGSLDFYPGGGGFRISGGARVSKNRVTLFAQPGATTAPTMNTAANKDSEFINADQTSVDLNLFIDECMDEAAIDQFGWQGNPV